MAGRKKFRLRIGKLADVDFCLDMFQRADKVSNLKKFVVGRTNFSDLNIGKYGVEQNVKNALQRFLSVVIINYDFIERSPVV